MTTVQTVLGPVAAADLGPTLVHEHVLNDASSAWRPPAEGDENGRLISETPVEIGFLGRLRDDPYLSRDNLVLDDEQVAAEELRHFADAGGRTLVDATVRGMGRDPGALQRISRSSGVAIVMGAGFYLERSHPPDVAGASEAELVDRIVGDIQDGVDGVRAGVIGEIGVSPSFTDAERRVLRAAAKAQTLTGVPLSVHLPGWQRLGHDVLDIVEREGVDPGSVVLGHLNPSGDDPEYQESLARRGAWLGFDMLGMELRFPGEGQSPSDEQSVAWLAGLIQSGHADRLLLSQDVFLKMLLRRYGGRGYAHVLTIVLERLAEHGIPAATTRSLVVDNPKRLFDIAAGTAAAPEGDN